VSNTTHNIPSDTLSDYVTLFRGRGDVYGHNEGRCVKEALTTEKFIDHLLGVEPIGVYPLVPVDGVYMCVWGCSDFDTADAYRHAIALQDAFSAAGIVSWVEKSRSKGYHVWVFAIGLVTATDMRNMFLAAHQVAEVPATEVNPKQTTLSKGQYGNYVRLPYPKYVDDTVTGQRMMASDGTFIPLGDFVELAMATRVEQSRIAELASMYQPPVMSTKTLADYVFDDVNLLEAMAKLSPLGQVIWRDGPLAGKDRSSTLARLGHVCVSSGLNPSETKAVLRTADQRWGKYHLRHDGESEIDKLVVRVHS
jgi:hypothetical protein